MDSEMEQLISTLGSDDDYISKARIVELIKTGNVDDMRNIVQFIDLSTFIDNTPPLHISIRAGQVEITELLLDSGADINQRDGDKRSPLHIAVRQKQYNIIHMLLDRSCEMNLFDDFGQYPLHTAIEHNDIDLVQLMLCSGSDVNVQNMYGKSCLHICIGRSSVELTEVLLNAGIDPALCDHNGQHPVHIAAKKNDLKSLHLLSTKQSTNVNVQDKLGRTALHWSVTNCNITLLDTLNESGVDLSLSNYFGESALFTSVLLYVGGRSEQRDIIMYLLERCDRTLINLPNNKGIVPLQLIVDKGDVKMAHLLLLNGADCNYRDNQGCTALHRAVYACDLDMVELLLTFGPDISLSDGQGNTCLHLAAFHGDLVILQLLLMNGAGRLGTMKNNLGQTPLHIAAARNKVGIVRCLLQCGSRTDVQDRQGNTALHYLACRTIGFTGCNINKYRIS